MVRTPSLAFRNESSRLAPPKRQSQAKRAQQTAGKARRLCIRHANGVQQNSLGLGRTRSYPSNRPMTRPLRQRRYSDLDLRRQPTNDRPLNRFARDGIYGKYVCQQSLCGFPFS